LPPRVRRFDATIEPGAKSRMWESFVPRTVEPPVNNPNFWGAVLPYVLADFGDGKSVLAAPRVRDGQMGLVLLEGNGEGGFTVATGEVSLRPFDEADARLINTSSMTEFSTGDLSPVREVGIAHSAGNGGAIPVLSENHIRTYWWCSPARMGMVAMAPDRWTARCKGASFPNAKWVRA